MLTTTQPTCHPLSHCRRLRLGQRIIPHVPLLHTRVTGRTHTSAAQHSRWPWNRAPCTSRHPGGNSRTGSPPTTPTRLKPRHSARGARCTRSVQTGARLPRRAPAAYLLARPPIPRGWGFRHLRIRFQLGGRSNRRRYTAWPRLPSSPCATALRRPRLSIHCQVPSTTRVIGAQHTRLVNKLLQGGARQPQTQLKGLSMARNINQHGISCENTLVPSLPGTIHDRQRH